MQALVRGRGEAVSEPAPAQWITGGAQRSHRGSNHIPRG